MRREDSKWWRQGYTSDWWRELPRAERLMFLEQLTPRDREEFFHDWRVWARDDQLAPESDWDTWIMRAGRGWGKAMALDTPVPTPGGWTTMGAIRTGDTVYAEDGQPCRVVEAHTVLLGRPCYRLRFSDGSEVVADAEHLWMTEDKVARKALGRARSPLSGPALRTTAQIAETLMVGKERNHSIRIAGPLQGHTLDLPIDPYLLGVWLGDGTSAAGEITTADPEILDAFRLAGEPIGAQRGAGGRSTTYAINAGYVGSVSGRAASFTGRLRALGVLRNKHIPQRYLRAAPEQRLALLQGLMDTDGYAEASKAEFCSTTPALADGVFELAASLGMKPRLAEDRARLNGVDCGPRYRVTFRPTVQVFRLPRKAARVAPLGAQALRNQRRYIVAVDPVPSVPVRCLTVDSPSRLYLIGRAMIPTHNTRTAVETIQDWVNEGWARRIAIVGQGEDDVRTVMVMGESGFIASAPSWNRPSFRPSVGGGILIWPNGCQAFIYSIADTEALRGPQFHAGWCDEPMAAPRAQRERALDNLEFCLRLGQHPRLILSMTPKPDPWLRALEKQAKDPENKIVVTGGNTHDNADNLASNFLRKIDRMYGGTKKGKQEIEGKTLGDEEGALWTEETLDACRAGWEDADPYEVAEDCEKVVVSIDPNTKGQLESSKAKSMKLAHAAGIVVSGRKGRDRFVFADRTISGGPLKWGAAAVRAAREFDADEFTAEGNQGGDMVKVVLQQAMEDGDFEIPIHINWSKRSKAARAEPVATMYEKGRVHHVGSKSSYEDLEMQMMYLHEGDDPTGEDFDRCDALVSGLTRHGVKKRASSGKSASGGGIRTMGDFARGASPERSRRSDEAPGGDPEF